MSKPQTSRRAAGRAAAVALAFGTVLLGVHTAHAKKKKKAASTAGCATKKCHKRVFSKKLVHGPVKAGKCTTCHKPKGRTPTGAHRPGAFRKVAGNAPCFGCHKGVAKELAGKVHKPVGKYGCKYCHRTHSGNNRFRLVTATVQKLCMRCHKKTKKKLKHVHGPMAAGACTACHSPHGSKNPHLLRKTGSALCFGCHDRSRFKPKYKHKALEKKGGCTNCHSGHGSQQQYFIKAKTTKLCATCHAKIMKLASTAKYKHKAIEKAGCAGCHNPHGSSQPKLLKKEELKVCASCHPERLKGKYKHGPVADGDCTGCHKPHGGQNYRMLAKPFPKAFYGPFSEKRYALCFECHESNILTTKLSRTVTGFRDGNKNLHYVHVVSPGKRRNKGRSCKACHEVHSGPQPKQIRSSVPFGGGGWKLPVHYTKTKNGGSCRVGCHVPRSYDRTKK